MLQYTDLTLDDVRYYWLNSLLMIKKDDKFIPCYIYDIDDDRRYPIILYDTIEDTRIVALTLTSFVRRVLMHHPSTGYGDYRGIPLYLSPRAGRERRKGVDRGNLMLLCPINWSHEIKLRIAAIAKHITENIGSKLSVTKLLEKEYHNLCLLYKTMAGRTRIRHIGTMPGYNLKVHAVILQQSVNNLYPRIYDAINYAKDEDVYGVSISRDFALIKGKDTHNLHLYHRLTNIGLVNTDTIKLAINKQIPSNLGQCFTLAFNAIRRD